MRRWIFATIWLALLMVAVASELPLLSYLCYLTLLLAVVMWVLSRQSLEGLEIVRTVGQTYAHLGDRVELTYELRNRHWMGKLWVEVSEESNWPEHLPGRVLSIGARQTRRWTVTAQAVRRGRYHLGPVVLRSGDPFGLFSGELRVPQEALVLVYPRMVPLPHWNVPGSFLEGSVLTGRRSLQATSMVMGVREYRPGDALNRIHWRSSARHRDLQVKEFELDRTADLWLILDLERLWHRGDGEDSTEERSVTVAASVMQKVLREHRNVGLVTSGQRVDLIHPDRGARQYGRLMQYLAEVRATGTRSLVDIVVEAMPRLRRGESALIVTPSLDPAWVRPAAALREAGVATQAVHVAGPADPDGRDRVRTTLILGELAVAGIRAAALPRDARIEDLFRGGSSAAA